MKHLNLVNPIDAETHALGLSERYGFVQSRDIVTAFERNDWSVESENYAKVRSEAKSGFQKHMVWLKNAELPLISGLSRENESAVRLCLVNSHDGSTRFNLFLGIMRNACLNQLLTGSIFKYFNAVHSKGIVSKLDSGINYVVQGIPDLIKNIQHLSAHELSLDAQVELARRVIPLRFENTRNLVDFDAGIVERFMRREDKGNDAYTVMNRLQEYLVRGGIPFRYNREVKSPLTNEVLHTALISTHTRKVSSISSQIKLNEAVIRETLKLIGA